MSKPKRQSRRRTAGQGEGANREARPKSKGGPKTAAAFFSTLWGAFTIEEAGAKTAALRLAIGSTDSLGRRFLHLPPVRGAVLRQICREVEHIQASMEATRLDSTHEQG